MFVSTAAYLAVGSIVAPDLWGNPLGPYIKAIPGAILALVGYAVAAER